MKFVVFVSFVSLKKKRGFELQRREVNPGFLRFDFGKENLLSEGVDGHTIYVVFAGLIPPGAYLGIWPGFGKFRAGPGCKNVVCSGSVLRICSSSRSVAPCSMSA